MTCPFYTYIQMIYVNIFNISSDQKNIQVSVKTTEDNNITSVKFWKYDTFKNTSEAIDLSFKLEQINESEVFNISLADVNESQYFTGIYFAEFETDATNDECSTCNNNVIAVTANFNNIKECILNKLLELNECGDIFTDPSCNGNEGVNIVNMQLMLDTITTSLELGYYDEAIYVYKDLLKICGKVQPCCDDLVSYHNYSGLNFGTLNNTLVLS